MKVLKWINASANIARYRSRLSTPSSDRPQCVALIITDDSPGRDWPACDICEPQYLVRVTNNRLVNFNRRTNGEGGRE